MQCPACGSTNTERYAAEGPLRGERMEFWKCLDCGERWERRAVPPDSHPERRLTKGAVTRKLRSILR